MAISSNDLQRLQEASTPALRGRIVSEIGAEFAAGDLTPRARADAVAIFRALLDDVEVEVRRSMSQALANTPDLPNDIAKRLARDVLEVSEPVIELSDALSEDDLVEIVENPVPQELRQNYGVGERSALVVEIERRLSSVARRSSVTGRLSDKLVEHGGAGVVATLLANPGATIEEPTAHKAMDRFGDDNAVQAAFAERESLPVAVVERLLFVVSEAMRDTLCTKHIVPPAVVAGVSQQVKERATMALLTDHSAATSRKLVDTLTRQDRLTATLILRGICTGCFAFVEHGLASMAGSPVEVVRSSLRHGEANELTALYRDAHIPAQVIPALDRAIAVAYRDGVPADPDDAKAYSTHMLGALSPVVTSGKNALPAGAIADIDAVIAHVGRGLAPSA